MSKKPEGSFAIQRGIYTNYLPGKLLLSSFRVLTIPVQYMIIKQTTSLPTPTFPLTLSNLALTPNQAMVLLMPSCIAAKHVYWALFIMREHLTLPFALFGGIIDMSFESLCSYVFTWSSRNPTWNPAFLYSGLFISVLGVTTQLVSEIQRSRFKKDPRNEGKIYAGGLWGWVRNVNYACNIVFGFGYGLGVGGPVYGALYAGIYVMKFVSDAIPQFEGYMQQKYGAKWEAVTKQVKWRLFPGIY
ncbi:hypothetical protein ABW19_dt0207685 [Dactylella cylindrospora]|nr:hypothetical protein ABW19_dt0207685 [Dactylella cylindrospora]